MSTPVVEQQPTTTTAKVPKKRKQMSTTERSGARPQRERSELAEPKKKKTKVAKVQEENRPAAERPAKKETKRQRVVKSETTQETVQTQPQPEQHLFMKLPGLKRLAYVAQIEKMSKHCYHYAIEYSNSLLRNIIHKACFVTEHGRKTTVSSTEMLFALETVGIRYYPSGESPQYFSVKKMAPKRKTDAKMRYYRKNADQLFLARKPIVRKVKEIASEVTVGYRFSPQAIDILQDVLEKSLIAVLESALMVTHSRNSKTLQYRDMEVALRICHTLGNFSQSLANVSA